MKVEIIKQNPRHATVKLNSEILDLLKRKNIYQSRTGSSKEQYCESYINRWKNGDIISFAKNCIIEPFCTIGAGKNLFSLGSFCSVMSELPVDTQIGRYCSIANGIKFFGTRHPVEAVSTSSAVFNPYREFVDGYLQFAGSRDGHSIAFTRVPNPQPQKAPIQIGHDVWIGADVQLSGNIEIGNGAVIAGRAIVSRDVPPYAVVGGAPARVLKYRFSEEVITALSATQWWDYELADLHRLPLADPAKFVNAFEREKNNIRLYKPDAVSVWDEIQMML